MWSNDYGQLQSLRTTVTGFSLIGEICGTNRYSIVEEFGGFSSLAVKIFQLVFAIFKFYFQN